METKVIVTPGEIRELVAEVIRDLGYTICTLDADPREHKIFFRGLEVGKEPYIECFVEHPRSESER